MSAHQAHDHDGADAPDGEQLPVTPDDGGMPTPADRHVPVAPDEEHRSVTPDHGGMP
jgi:hypothetical protein